MLIIGESLPDALRKVMFDARDLCIKNKAALTEVGKNHLPKSSACNKRILKGRYYYVGTAEKRSLRG